MTSNKTFHFELLIATNKTWLHTLQVREVGGGFFGPPQVDPLSEEHLLAAFEQTVLQSRKEMPSTAAEVFGSRHVEPARRHGSLGGRQEGRGVRPHTLFEGLFQSP